MRIIGGEYKGRRISMPRGIRPTRDNVREAIFNVIASDIRGSRVLNLFAGSGAFGIEAISRGASYALFVDNSSSATSVIRRNLKSLGLQHAARAGVITKDARLALRSLSNSREIFDIVFLDPPYYKGWVRKCLKYLYLYDILTQPNLIIAEHFKKDRLPDQPEGLKLRRRLSYGDTAISIYGKL